MNTSSSNDDTVVLREDKQGRLYPGSPLSDEAKRLRLPGLELISELGSGGMGRVYLARQVKLGRLVAIKALKLTRAADPQLSQWLEDEAVTMAAMNHPNVVGIYEMLQKNGLLFIVMEYVPGRHSIRDLVTRFGPLPENVVLRILEDVVNGLLCVKSKGYIHRDMKPDNLLVSYEEDHEPQSIEEMFRNPQTRVKICDFGIARQFRQLKGEAPHSDLRAMGSPNYMAPEQITDPEKVDFRADIYSLASTALFMLTANPPFPIQDRDELLTYKIEHDLPSPAEAGVKVTPTFNAILQRMGRLLPEKRYQHYTDLQRELALHSLALPNSIGVTKPPRNPFWKVFGICVLLLLLVLGIILGNDYINEHFYRERLISLSSALSFWNPEGRSGWRTLSIDGPHDHKNTILMGHLQDEPHNLTLFTPVLPGYILDFQILNQGTCSAIFQLDDQKDNDTRLLWTRSPDGECSFSFYHNNRLYPIEGIELAHGLQWIPIQMRLSGKSVAIHINNELATTVHCKNANPRTFHIKIISGKSLSLRQIYLYEEEK
ncbi:MAG: serine/threonine protein kinase [Victivallales bacterium]|nr:serine/threonine protein kinase [Victivallales bacterium]